MNRTIYLKCTFQITINADEGLEIEDIVSDLGVDSISDDGSIVVTNYQLEKSEVTDSK